VKLEIGDRNGMEMEIMELEIMEIMEMEME
jgi:hypothetical protein